MGVLYIIYMNIRSLLSMPKYTYFSLIFLRGVHCQIDKGCWL